MHPDVQPSHAATRAGRWARRAGLLSAAVSMLLAGAAGAQSGADVALAAKEGTVKSVAPKRLSVHRRSNVYSAQFASGPVLHVREMPADEGRFTLTLTAAGGEILETAPTRGLTQLAVSAWRTPATRTVSREAFAEALDEAGLRIGAWPGPDHIALSISGPAQSLEEAVRLALLLVAEPAVTPEAFSEARDQAAKYAADRSLGATLRGEIGRARLAPGADDVRFAPPGAETLRRRTAPEAQVWLDSWLPGAPVEFAIVGDVTLNEAIAAASRHLASIGERPEPDAGVFASRRQVGVAQRGARIEGAYTADSRWGGKGGQAAPGGASGGAEKSGNICVAIAAPGCDASDIRTHRMLRLSAELLDSCLEDRLKAEGVEPGFARAFTDPAIAYPGHGALVMAAGVPASSAGEALASMHACLDELGSSGPTEEQLAAAAEELAEQATQAESKSDYWAGLLAQSILRGFDPDAVAEGAAMYRSFGVKDVVDALRDRVGTEGRVEIILRPEPQTR